MTDRNSLLNDDEQSLRLALDGRQAMMWTAMPCIVISVDLAAMTISARPTIQGSVQQQDGSTAYVNLPLLLDVPICFPSAGGFTLTFPVQPGDEVLVVFASRCIDSWWSNGGIGRPMEARMHDLSDAVAIPGPKSLPNVLSGINPSVAELRNNSGTIRLKFDASGFEIVGNLKVSGNITTTTGDVIAGTVSLKTHTHSVSVPATPFTGTTGAPV